VVIYVCGIRIRFPVILSVTAILRSKTQGEMNNSLYQQICEHDAKFNSRKLLIRISLDFNQLLSHTVIISVINAVYHSIQLDVVIF
jgi:hypothetical protein